MNAKLTDFWSRLRRPFARPRGAHGDTASNLGLDDPIAPPTGSDGPGMLARWSARDRTLARLEEGYEKMSQVIEELRQHMADAGNRGERMCESLEQLARALSDQPARSQQQAEMLATIAAQLESTNQRSAHVAEVLAEIPRISRQHGEALSGINRQLEIAGEHTLAQSQIMDRVSTTLAALGDANASQTEALRQMNRKTSDQNEMLTTLIAAQAKRFTMLFVVTLILAAAAVAVSLGAILVLR